MKGGFAGLIFAVHYIQPVLKGDIQIVEFTESLNVQT